MSNNLRSYQVEQWNPALEQWIPTYWVNIRPGNFRHFLTYLSKRYGDEAHYTRVRRAPEPVAQAYLFDGRNFV